MRDACRAVSLTLVVAQMACSSESPFVSEEGQFSVAFPDEPVYQTIPVQDGPVTITRHIYTYSDEHAAYLVQYVDLVAPPDMTPDALLDASRMRTRETLGQAGGTVSSETRIQRFGYPGRDWTFQVAGVPARNRVLLVGRRLYSILCSPTAGSISNSSTAEAFIESFRYRGVSPPANDPREPRASGSRTKG